MGKRQDGRGLWGSREANLIHGLCRCGHRLVGTEGRQTSRNRRTERFDLLIEKVDTGQLDRSQVPMMVPHQPRQSLFEQWDLPPHPAFGQRRHGLRVRAPRNQGVQHCAPRDPHNI